jgi:hypothetical protein
MKRAKKNRQPNNALNLSKTQADAVSLLIATQTERGMQAFVVAGAEVLQSEFDFTPEQASQWATMTIKAGTKYLRPAGGETAVYTGSDSYERTEL